MTIQKNIPDRIKLILQFVVFTLATCFVLFLVVILSDIVSNPREHRMLILIGIPASSILIQGAIFIHRWRKLIQQEKSGDLPDMKDMRNITGRQMIFLAIGAPLFVTSFVLFQFDYKPAAALCFISFLVLVAVEKAYVKRRYKRIKEGCSIE